MARSRSRRSRLRRAFKLGQRVNGHPEHIDAVVPELLTMLADEEDVLVLVQLARSLGHAWTPPASVALVPLATHRDERVRLAVAQSLPNGIDIDSPDELHAVADALIGLTSDLRDDVRDWACFGLGTHLRDLDTPQLRDALAARLADPHDDTRCEALLGLAYRQDGRASAVLLEALDRDVVYRLEVEAAAALGDPATHALLSGHLDGWDDPKAAEIAHAASRLTDPDGVGQDFIGHLADLMRAVAEGKRQYPGPGPWWNLLCVIDDLAPHRMPGIARATLAALNDQPDAQAALRRGWLGQHLDAAGNLLD